MMIFQQVNNGTKRSTELNLQLWILQVPRFIDWWAFPCRQSDTANNGLSNNHSQFAVLTQAFFLFFSRSTSSIISQKKDHRTHGRKLWLFRMWKLMFCWRGLFHSFPSLHGRSAVSDENFFSSRMSKRMWLVTIKKANDSGSKSYDRTASRVKIRKKSRTIMWKMPVKSSHPSLVFSLGRFMFSAFSCAYQL